MIFHTFVIVSVFCKASFVQSDNSLQDLVDKLWQYDSNRLSKIWDYRYDLQAKAYYQTSNGMDRSSRPLLPYIDSNALNKPTYKAFIALLDNYYPEVGRKEYVTSYERRETWKFIDAVLSSKVMQEVYEYLKYRGKAPYSRSDFRKEIYNMWFGLYRRSRSYDSCGFEHVFVGERKDKVLGLHNWIQFYLQEKKKKLNYIGYLNDRRNFPLLAVQFTWDGKLKPVGSIFLGTSPEFEMALYTLVYRLGLRSVYVKVNGQPVQIKCYSMAGKIGTCYASAR